MLKVLIFICLFHIKCNCGNVFLNVKRNVFMGKKLISVLEGKPFAAFWRIPYCQPPLNKLRFKAPKPIDWYDGIFDFSDYSNEMCKRYYEDRLYLSVYMPITKNITMSLPVIVWLEENPDENLKSPDFFIEEEVVFVSATYRTSIFGFLNTGDDFATGNMGAKDALKALNWVQDNISSFNGDPKRVTVAGMRNSATIVSSLLLSPLGQGLFKRLIMLSGSALSPADYRPYNFDIMKKLYWMLNGPFERFNRSKLYNFLRNCSTLELIQASQNIFDSTEIRDNQRLINAFGPSIETSKNSFMNKYPLDIYKTWLTNTEAEVIMGFTNLESLYKLQGFVRDKKLLKYLNYNFQYLLPFEGTKDDFGSSRYKNIRQKIKEFYFINGTIREKSLRRYAKYVSDQVIYPVLRQARLQAEVSRANVYLYRFSLKGLLNIGRNPVNKNLSWYGATSGDEICYLFKCKSINDIYKSSEMSNERHFIKKFVRLLANFVKHGDPTPNGNDKILDNLKWEPVRCAGTIRGLKLDFDEFKMIDLPEEKRMKFWEQLKSEFFSEKDFKDEL
ncbi:hypothetical protein ACJJTC_006900 [Scirpophaga incertulas]